MVYIDQNRINVYVYVWSDLNRMVVKEALPLQKNEYHVMVYHYSALPEDQAIFCG